MSKIDKAKVKALADRHVKKGKLQEAIQEYRKLLSGDEQDIAIRNTIGELYVKSNQKDKAVEEFKVIADLYTEKGLYSKSIASLKRIIRLKPKDLETGHKLADLYQNQGFISEAKAEYAKLAKAYAQAKDIKKAIKIFEKLLTLSPEDMDARLALAELCTQDGKIETALEELNKVARFEIRNNRLKEAQKILNQAKALKADDTRTLSNLIEIYKRENKKKEALALVNEILKKDKDDVQALYILGNIYFDNKDFPRAKEIFTKIIDIKPKDVEACVKLGRIFIQEGQLDKAFELYEPLVDTLIRKQKEEKAIGLLGLMLSEKKPHLPTLEKLATLYRGKGQKNNFEVVSRVILEEYRKFNLKGKMLSLLEEMVNFFPDKEDYYYEYKQIQKELGVSGEIIRIDQPQEAEQEEESEEDVIEKTIEKADLYIEQGLMRNAKRLLDNLRLRFPDNPKVNKKIDEISGIPLEIQSDKIADRVVKVREKETELFPPPSAPSPEEVMEFPDADSGEKLSAADLFAETDIIPDVAPVEGEKKYYTLSDKIKEELDAIRAVYHHQIRGDTTIVEKTLDDILSDFRKALDEKVGKEDYESRYNLAIAFLEQGLLDEAIEECKLAAKSKKFEIDCYNIISFCFRKKKDFPLALNWLEKAQNLVAKDSNRAFALMYDMATIYEDMQDQLKALKSYREVKKWDADYRDVSEKVSMLQKNTKTASSKK